VAAAAERDVLGVGPREVERVGVIETGRIAVRAAGYRLATRKISVLRGSKHSCFFEPAAAHARTAA